MDPFDDLQIGLAVAGVVLLGAMLAYIILVFHRQAFSNPLRHAPKQSPREVMVVHWDKANLMIRSGEWKLAREEDKNFECGIVYLERVTRA